MFFNPDFDFTNNSQFESNYNWSFGDGGASSTTNPSYYYQDTGFFAVTLIVGNSIGCMDTVIKVVQVEDVFVLHVPNAFSPNGDKKNDDFGIYTRGMVNYNIIIFNRWGEILWQSSEASDRWNGEYKGEVLEIGMYFYSINGTDYEGNAVEKNGQILIMR